MQAFGSGAGVGGKDRPVTTIEDPIEIQWAKRPEPEPEPEPVAEPASWAGVHPAMEGAALGTALQRAADARSYEEVHADPPPFPASGPERDVIEWLGQAGLAKHAEALVAMGLRSMAHCGSVSPEDLAAAGMTEAEARMFYTALRLHAGGSSGAEAAQAEEEDEQEEVVSATMGDQRSALLQIMPEHMRALYEQKRLQENLASMRGGPPLERADGLPSAAELEARAARPDDPWQGEAGEWAAEDNTPASWEDDAADGAAEELRKQKAFAGEDEEEEDDEGETAAQRTEREIAALQADVDRWQREIEALSGATPREGGPDSARAAAAASQRAAQERLGKLQASAKPKNAKPKMSVARGVQGPPK